MEYLSKFTPAANPQNSGSVGAALTQRFASRLLVFFVRHSSLLRPLSQAGKLQLAKASSLSERRVFWTILASLHRVCPISHDALPLDLSIHRNHTSDNA